jgi:hypothetical protein
MKPTLEKIGYALFKMMLAVPPDDNFIKPIVDGKLIPLDFDLLRKTDFAIEVVVAPGGTAAAEDRYGLLLGLVQNFISSPVGQIPGAMSKLLGLMAKGTANSMPDLSDALRQMAEELPAIEQEQRAMMQKQMQMEQAGQKLGK